MLKEILVGIVLTALVTISVAYYGMELQNTIDKQKQEIELLQNDNKELQSSLEKNYYFGIYTSCLAEVQNVDSCNKAIYQLRKELDMYNHPNAKKLRDTFIWPPQLQEVY